MSVRLIWLLRYGRSSNVRVRTIWDTCTSIFWKISLIVLYPNLWSYIYSFASSCWRLLTSFFSLTDFLTDTLKIVIWFTPLHTKGFQGHPSDHFFFCLPGIRNISLNTDKIDLSKGHRYKPLGWGPCPHPVILLDHGRNQITVFDPLYVTEGSLKVRPSYFE